MKINRTFSPRPDSVAQPFSSHNIERTLQLCFEAGRDGYKCKHMLLQLSLKWFTGGVGLFLQYVIFSTQAFIFFVRASIGVCWGSDEMWFYKVVEWWTVRKY